MNTHTYKRNSKYFVCKTIRLCKYLNDKGFHFDKVRPDKVKPYYNVWIYQNTDDLYDAVVEYFNERKALRAE